MRCEKCRRKFDPAMDFVEDSDIMEAVGYYVGETYIEEFCPDCILELNESIRNTVNMWRPRYIEYKGETNGVSP